MYLKTEDYILCYNTSYMHVYVRIFKLNDYLKCNDSDDDDDDDDGGGGGGNNNNNNNNNNKNNKFNLTRIL